MNKQEEASVAVVQATREIARTLVEFNAAMLPVLKSVAEAMSRLAGEFEEAQ